MSAPQDLGIRLGNQQRRLRLLVEHLAGQALRRQVEAEDLVQEVYLRTLSVPVDELPPFEPGEARLARWLNTVARHVVVDAARAARAAKRDGRTERLQRSAWSQHGQRESRIPGHGPGPSTRVAGAEEEQRLLGAYRELAPDHRRVLGLRQFEGLSAAETGRRMGRSEAAVHSLYRRALVAWEALADKNPGRRDDSARAPRLDGVE